MAEWYYSTDKKQQRGPVSSEELGQLAREGRLKPSDLVWTDGMKDWARASSQKFLAPDKYRADDGGPALRTGHPVEDDDLPRRRDQDDWSAANADRPRPGRRRRAEGGMPVGVKVGLIVGGLVLLLIVVGAGLYVVMRPSAVHEIAGGMGTFQGILGPNDPRDPIMGGPSRVHDVRMVRGRTYVIDLRSAQFDAFLRLEDSAFTQLAQDDDSGGNLDARIIFRCPRTGNFRVIATGLPNSRGNGVGAYTLAIRENR